MLAASEEPAPDTAVCIANAAAYGSSDPAAHLLAQHDAASDALKCDSSAVAAAADDSPPDPREATYWRSVVWCSCLMFLLYSGQMIVQVGVLPDRLITYYNSGVDCSGSAASRPDCKHAAAHETLIMSIVASIGCFVTFLGSPLLGTASDAFGRKPALFFCAFLNLLLSLALIGFQYGVLPIEVFFAATVLAAFDSTSVILAYLSDTVPPHRRALSFGLVFAVISATVIAGPFVGTSVSTNTAFVISAAVALAFLLSVLILPESLPPSQRIPFSSARDLNPFLVLRVLTRYKMFVRLAAVVLVGELLMRGRFAVLFPFLKSKFSITQQQYAFVALTFGVCGVFAQSVVLKILVARCKNVTIMNISLIAVACNMLAYALVGQLWQIYALELLSSIGFLSFPSISAMKSNNVNASEQGKIQGALYGIKQLGGGVGPVVFGAIFNAVSSPDDQIYSPELIWFIATAIGLLGVALGFSVPGVVSQEESEKHEQEKAESEAQRKAEELAAVVEGSKSPVGALNNETLQQPLIGTAQTWE